MMRTRTKGYGAAAVTTDAPAEPEVWEVRPGGMLVQKRNPESEPAAPVATIRVKVKYGSTYHEIYISSQASFGELKKLLSERTGLHALDQKLLFKGKEKDSNAYLDISGVKDRAKLVLLEDPTAKAKRLLELRHTAKMEKASKSISSISLEVDRLSSQVSSLDEIVSKGKKVAENDVLNLIDQLMMMLIKLDGIVAEGESKQQRGMQVKRVQKYLETLDVIKIKNNGSVPSQQKIKNNGSIPSQPQPQSAKNNGPIPSQQKIKNNGSIPAQPQQQSAKNNGPIPSQHQQQHSKKQPPKSAVVTTDWEMFDSLFLQPSNSAATSTATTATSTSTTSSTTPTPRFDWELF